MIATSFIYRVFLVFVTCLLVACTKNIINNKQIEGFNGDGLEKSRVIFGGLTSQSSEWTIEEVSKYSSIAVNTLSDKRPELKIAGSNYLAKVLGPEVYRTTMQHIHDGNTLDKSQLTQISTHEPGYRYIIFSRIEGDFVTQSDRDETTSKKDVYKIYETKRTTFIHSEVYDLATTECAWSGTLKHQVVKEKRIRHHVQRSFFWDLIVSLLESSIYESYPEPESLDSMIHVLYVSLADNLPKRGCTEIGVLNCVKREIRLL